MAPDDAIVPSLCTQTFLIKLSSKYYAFRDLKAFILSLLNSFSVLCMRYSYRSMKVNVEINEASLLHE